MPDGADMIRLLLAIILVPFIRIFMVRSILDLANFIQVDKVNSIDAASSSCRGHHRLLIFDSRSGER